METCLLRLRDSWPALSVLVLACIVTVLAVQGQPNVTMTITGTVLWGDSRGQPTPQGYSKGAPIPGITVIAFLLKGTTEHGMPIYETLSQTTTNKVGQYTLTFSVSSEEKFVRLWAINSWGEGLSFVPVAAGTSTVDLSVDFGHLATGPATTTAQTQTTTQVFVSSATTTATVNRLPPVILNDLPWLLVFAGVILLALLGIWLMAYKLKQQRLLATTLLSYRSEHRSWLCGKQSSLWHAS